MTAAQESPITGLCIVADPEKCPPGYELIYKSHDKGDDCDLWKDGFFRQRVTRYLCVTRVFPLDGGRLNNILADISILGEKEAPYQGFAMLEKTQDTGEPCLKKKTIAVKMVPRNSVTEAVTNVIILSKSRRALAGYTLIGGDINGLTICYKMGLVPPETQQQQQAPTVNHHNPSLVHPPTLPNSNSFDLAMVNSHNHSSGILTRQESVTGSSTAVTDVPFQLHTRFRDPHSIPPLPSVNYKNANDIENAYSYSFMVERSTTANTS